jgi:hypothetical protein
VGLLAVAALPSLIYLLAIALFTFFTVSLPLYQGRLPDAISLSASNALTAPLSTLVSLAAIPLGVLVALGLRFAVLQDCEWREALGRAWRLGRSRFVDVALMYLVILGITTAVVIVMGIVVGVVVSVGGIGIAVMVSGAGVSAPVVVLGVVVALISMLVLAAGSVATFTWVSVAWTLFWRRAIGAEQPAAPVPAAPFATPFDPALSGSMKGDLT